jgi:hypothetical protein
MPVYLKLNSIESIEAIVCSYPHETFLILKNRGNGTLREPVFDIDMPEIDV